MHLRVARPTNDLKRLSAMYRDGLGLVELGSFEDHEGFDGVMLGYPGSDYHLELTHHRGQTVKGAPTEENLLVFYEDHPGEWWAVCERMVNAGFKKVHSYNPYWDRNGATFEDPEGYRVVLQKASWD